MHIHSASVHPHTFWPGPRTPGETQSSDLLLRSGCSKEQCERRADGTPTCLFSPLLLFPLSLPQPGPGLNLEGNPPWDEWIEEEAGLA